MNPFLYKAHPLILHWAAMLAQPSAYTLNDWSEWLLTLMTANLAWAAALWWFAPKAADIRLPCLRAYILALPASLLYPPLLLTVMADLASRSFQVQDRYLLIFSIFVATQMLGGFHALALRHRNGRPAGLVAGMNAALFLLLAALPICLLMHGLYAVLR